MIIITVKFRVPYLILVAEKGEVLCNSKKQLQLKLGLGIVEGQTSNLL